MSMVRWKWKKWVDTFCFLLTFLLLFFSLFVSFSFGSLDFLEAGCVSAASFAFVLRVRELLLARYPLVMSTDWTLTEDRVKLKKWNSAVSCLLQYAKYLAWMWKKAVTIWEVLYWICVCWSHPRPHLHCLPVQHLQGWPASELPGHGVACAGSQTGAA